MLNDTDVLLWWGHMAHEEVSDGLIDRVQQRVLKGMGLVVLHSGHHSKLFRRLMGTNATSPGGSSRKAISSASG